MSKLHPDIERLAELADEAPTPFEREHLAECPSCASDLAAYRRLVAAARDERRRIAPALTDWDRMRAQLDAEGLITSPAVRSRRVRRVRWMQRAAAAAVLVASGTVAGRWSAGMPLAQAVAGGAAPVIAHATAVLPAGATERSFDSPESALAQLQQAQRQYDEAASWLSAHDTTSAFGASEQYRTRLAALDMASETFEQALTDAPEDPILNQYFMATMNAREVAIRRLGSTLPVGVRVGRF
ncbi:MAG: hypothetical protein IPK85_11390 [Gemmatimonadetes bacterium]|nr:hypothetical protein [Gemmatimonadota bacterium]